MLYGDTSIFFKNLQLQVFVLHLLYISFTTAVALNTKMNGVHVNCQSQAKEQHIVMHQLRTRKKRSIHT